MKRKFLLTILIIFNVLFCFASTADALNLQNAFQVDNGSATDPLDTMAMTAGYKIDNSSNLGDVISKVIQVVLSMLGVVFLVLLIYGGFLWMTARGNEQQVEKAKEVMYSSIIGLIIVLGAYAISYFVLDKLSGGLLAPFTI